MVSVEFLRPRLLGARFSNGEIPLQVLADLKALREMVIDVAKWRYLSENPGRQRVPRGFADKIDLKLTGISDGSAVPIINITTTEAMLPGAELPYQRFFVLAKNDIAITIETASESGNAPINGHLPIRFLAYFSPIGRSLRDGESIEFPMPNGSPPARLTQETRQRLLRRSDMEELTHEVTLRGAVAAADQYRMTFEIQQVYGDKIAGPMPEQHRDAIITAFNGYRDNVRILVQGIGRFDRQNRLSGLESIEQVSPLDPLDVPARLDDLRAMHNGWLDGTGSAPSHRGLDWFSSDFDRYYPPDVPTPYTYPTPEGGIQLEWSLGSQEVSLKVNLDTKVAIWHQLDVSDSSDDGQEQELILDNASGWNWLGQEILRLSEETQ